MLRFFIVIIQTTGDSISWQVLPQHILLMET